MHILSAFSLSQKEKKHAYAQIKKKEKLILNEELSISTKGIYVYSHEAKSANSIEDDILKKQSESYPPWFTYILRQNL